jgi:hypothetical protein
VKVNMYASTAHYAEHLAPIMAALPPEHRGEMFAGKRGQPWGAPLMSVKGSRDPGGWWMVAGYGDLRAVAGSPVVYVEHGAGQAYEGTRNGSYSGGAGHAGVKLYIAPSRRVEARWRAAYPAVPVAVVGCPKLDRFHTNPAPVPSPPVVAVTFHWDCQVVPETRSAWRHYDRHLPGLKAAVEALGGTLIGHGHPRLWQRIRPRWVELGVEPVPALADVLTRASLLIADNTSAMYEFASLDRPVVAMNAPWYRRDVHHGMRFWDAVPGVQVNSGTELPGAVRLALADPPDLARLRRAAVASVYAHTDGAAASRAAAAIMEVMGVGA